MQLVASIGELTPQPVVNSSKGLDAQEPPAVALSHSYELEPVIQASSKSPEPVHDVPFVSMTHMRLKVLKKTLMIIEKHSSSNPKAQIKEVVQMSRTLLTSLFPPQSVNVSTSQLQKKPGSRLSLRFLLPSTPVLRKTQGQNLLPDFHADL